MMQKSAAPLREQAVSALRQRIVSGELEPGERLKERILVDDLNVSRTVVREALRQLESEKLIHTVSNVGPFVARITADEARKLYEVRAALEGTAAKLAAVNRTHDQLKQLHEALKYIDEHFEEPNELLTAKQRFYEVLIRASRNDIIGEQLAGVQARVSQLRRVTLQQPGRGRRMVGELQRVMNAIAAGDPNAAYEASIEHVQTAAIIAMNYLKEQAEE